VPWYDQQVAAQGFEQMVARFTSQGRSLLAGLSLCLLATAADSSPPSGRGKVLLQQNCGRCHAIGPVGRSPLKQAPPVRDIYARFDPRELQAELREGMVSRHQAMPQIDFSDEDVDAILAYLYALAVRK
jgi:cytochrome c